MIYLHFTLHQPAIADGEFAFKLKSKVPIRRRDSKLRTRYMIARTTYHADAENVTILPIVIYPSIVVSWQDLENSRLQDFLNGPFKMRTLRHCVQHWGVSAGRSVQMLDLVDALSHLVVRQEIRDEIVCTTVRPVDAHDMVYWYQSVDGKTTPECNPEDPSQFRLPSTRTYFYHSAQPPKHYLNDAGLKFHARIGSSHMNYDGRDFKLPHVIDDLQRFVQSFLQIARATVNLSQRAVDYKETGVWSQQLYDGVYTRPADDVPLTLRSALAVAADHHAADVFALIVMYCDDYLRCSGDDFITLDDYLRCSGDDIITLDGLTPLDGPAATKK